MRLETEEPENADTATPVRNSGPRISDRGEEEEREWEHADELQTVEQRICEELPLKMRQESFILRYDLQYLIGKKEIGQK